MTSLALSLLLAASAGADGDQLCREIRSVDRLAKQERLDRDTLKALKRRYCRGNGHHHDDHDEDEDPRPPPPPPAKPRPQVTADCMDLSMMTRLVKMTDSGSMLPVVDQQRALACALERNLAPFAWPNRATAKSPDGTWRYPNGQTAKYPDGTRRYANGTTAKYPDGTWRYPNGATAKYADGTWQSPRGLRRDPAQLLLEAGVPPSVIGRLHTMSPDEHDLTVVEAVWAARK